MRKLPQADGISRLEESIHIGGVFASAEPAVVRTILGSCIAVCLRDPITRVGGMNHFMLPGGKSDSKSPTSYGVHAMELLINRCMRMGAERSRLEAKVFGGGHVLRVRESEDNVPRANIRFAREFLRTEGIPVVSHDVGGYGAREVFFFIDSGRTLLRRLADTGTDSRLQELLKPEQMMNAPRSVKPGKIEPGAIERATNEPENDDNVTLF